MTLFSRKHPPKGLLLLELWTTHDGLIYLRYAATGSMHMNFVTETCAWRTKFVISDCIANEIDFIKLAQGSRCTRNLETLSVLKAFREFGSETACKRLSFGLGIMISYSEIRLEVCGDLITSEWFESVLRKTALGNRSGDEQFSLEMSIKRAMQGPSVIPLQEQLMMLNSFPCLNLSYKSKDSHLSVAQGFSLTSAKSLLLCSQVNVGAISSALNSYLLTHTRKMRIPRLRPRAKGIAMFTRATTQEAADLLNFKPQHIQVTCSGIHIFKSSFQQKGILKLCWLTPHELHVLWNKFDVNKGIISFWLIVITAHNF